MFYFENGEIKDGSNRITDIVAIILPILYLIAIIVSLIFAFLLGGK